MAEDENFSKMEAGEIPGLTAEEQRFVSCYGSGKAYMSYSAVRESEPDAALISAFEKTLAFVCGQDLHENAGKRNNPWIDNEISESGKDRTVENAMTFSELHGLAALTPIPDVTTFTWDESRAKVALDSFNDAIQNERQKQSEAEAANARQAIARAEAASLGHEENSHQKPPRQSKKRLSFNADPVVWAAQEDATASSVLRELRAGLLRLRKGSSRAPSEGSPIWSLVSQKSAKLKPEAAAEMARARIAAAAAAAVMRDSDASGQPRDSLGDLTDSKSSHQASLNHETSQFGLSLGYMHTSQMTDVSRFPHELFPRENSHGTSFLSVLPLDKAARWKNVSKKKRVEFAPGTVFHKHL